MNIIYFPATIILLPAVHGGLFFENKTTTKPRRLLSHIINPCTTVYDDQYLSQQFITPRGELLKYCFLRWSDFNIKMKQFAACKPDRLHKRQLSKMIRLAVTIITDLFSASIVSNEKSMSKNEALELWSPHAEFPSILPTMMNKFISSCNDQTKNRVDIDAYKSVPMSIIALARAHGELSANIENFDKLIEGCKQGIVATRALADITNDASLLEVDSKSTSIEWITRAEDKGIEIDYMIVESNVSLNWLTICFTSIISLLSMFITCYLIISYIHYQNTVQAHNANTDLE